MACVSGYESFWAFSKEKKGYSGVVTYLKDELTPLDAKADCLGDFDDPSLAELCNEGRLVDTDHGSFILINVYAPNAGEKEQGRLRLGFKLKFLEALKRKCDELVCLGRHVVIVGDFNVAHTDQDVHKKWNIRDIYSSAELAFIDAFFTQYVDLFRYFHPDAEGIFSVWNQKTEARIHNEGVRIDYAVCDKGFVSQVLSTDIVKMVPKTWSDHAAVVLTLKDQPMLPAHPRPAISSHNMKQFQEDCRQKKLTTLFSTGIKGSIEMKGAENKHTGSQHEIKSNIQSGPTECMVYNSFDIHRKCIEFTPPPLLYADNGAFTQTDIVSDAGDSTVMSNALSNKKEVAKMTSSPQPKLVSPELPQDESPALMPVLKASRDSVETSFDSPDRATHSDHAKAAKDDKVCIGEECVGITTLKTEEAINLMPPSSKQSDRARPKRQKSHSKSPTYKLQKLDSKSASNSAAGSQIKQKSLTSYFHRDAD